MPNPLNRATKHVLDNGMTILLKESHSAPVTSWWVLYRVGSRNESPGLTGVSHWVEHMLFKGTERFPAGYLVMAIDREGGVWNAQTSFDYTAFYETMPTSRIELALEAEADRMVNARFLLEEVESERTVIISERQGSENSPLFWLFEQTRSSAFRVHPYQHQIIGEMADLEQMTRDDLFAHYKTYYAPSNAIAVAVGDFDSGQMLDRIIEYYGSIPAGTEVLREGPVEPEQRNERRVIVERAGNTGYIYVAYRSPSSADPDWMRMALVDSILAGASAPGGGGIGNRTSRLYKAIVEAEYASSVGGGLYPSVDPHLQSIVLTLREGRGHAEVQAALDAEITRVADGDIHLDELVRAKKQAKSLFAYGTESVTGQAFWLAFSENFESYAWYEEYLDRLDAITLDEVRDAASRYLRESQRTVGWFIPRVDDIVEKKGD